MAFFTKQFSSTINASGGSGSGGFLNPSKIADGGSARFLILSEEPVCGFELWFAGADGKNKPVRTEDEPTPAFIAATEKPLGATLVVRDGKPAIKPFTAFYVYDYEANAVKVFSATQVSILADLDRKLSDPDFEDLTAWDVEISRKGKGMETRYTVDMKPTRAKGAVAEAAQAAYADVVKAGGSLGALFTGDSPFGTGK
jgi:hypothetical protein